MQRQTLVGADPATRRPPIPNPLTDLGWTAEIEAEAVATKIREWYDRQCMRPDGRITDPAVVADVGRRANVVIIGEAPARNELREGRPFCGPAGDELKLELQSVGLGTEWMLSGEGREEPARTCGLTNATFWFCESGTPPNRDTVRAAAPALAALCAACRPRHIVAAGKFGVRAAIDPDQLRGDNGRDATMSNLVGQTRPAGDAITALMPEGQAPPRVWVIWHPAYILHRREHGGRDRERNIETLRRMVAEIDRHPPITTEAPESPLGPVTESRGAGTGGTDETHVRAEESVSDDDWVNDWIK